jgi:hypothetical protein
MDGALHQRVRGLVVHLGDQPEAAGILFEIGAVERALETVLSVHSVFKKAAAAENGEKSFILTGQGLGRQCAKRGFPCGDNGIQPLRRAIRIFPPGRPLPGGKLPATGQFD